LRERKEPSSAVVERGFMSFFFFFLFSFKKHARYQSKTISFFVVSRKSAGFVRTPSLLNKGSGDWEQRWAWAFSLFLPLVKVEIMKQKTTYSHFPPAYRFPPLPSPLDERNQLRPPSDSSIVFSGKKALSNRPFSPQIVK